MLIVKYPSKTYTVDTTRVDSDYLKSIVSLDNVVNLTLFEDILDCILNNPQSLYGLDPEYVFKGLSYFGCSKLLQDFFMFIKNSVYNKEKKNIQDRIEQYLEKHVDKINWPMLCNKSNLSEEFLERHLHRLNWGYLCGNKHLTEAFIERHIDKMGWNLISHVSCLSESFFERYIDKVNWEYLSENKGLSDDFFERHIDKVVWNGRITRYRSENFIRRHIDKKDEFSWGYLVSNKSISEEFIEEYIDYMHKPYYQWETVCFKHFSEAFFERHLDKVDWFTLCMNSSISESFFERHLDKVDWHGICRNKSISESFFENHLDKVDWFILSRNSGLSESFFERHLDKVQWARLCGNSNISEDFLERHYKDVDWFGVVQNKSVSEGFLFKYHTDFMSTDYFMLVRSRSLPEYFVERLDINPEFFTEFYFNIENRIAERIEKRIYYTFDSLWKPLYKRPSR